MSQVMQGYVGVIQGSDNGTHPVILGRLGSMVIEPSGADYEWGTYRAFNYTTSLQIPSIISTISPIVAAGGFTGIAIANPPSSGVIVDIIDAVLTFTGPPPAGTVAVVWAAQPNPIAGNPFIGTLLPTQPTAIGGAKKAVEQVFQFGTIVGSLVVVRNFAAPSTIQAEIPHSLKDEVKGALGITPGCQIVLQTIGTPVAAMVSITTTEKPYP